MDLDKHLTRFDTIDAEKAPLVYIDAHRSQLVGNPFECTWRLGRLAQVAGAFAACGLSAYGTRLGLIACGHTLAKRCAPNRSPPQRRLEDKVDFSFTAVQDDGRLWVVVVEASKTLSIPELKLAAAGSSSLAFGGPECRLADQLINTGETLVKLTNCSLTQADIYEAIVYVEDSNGNDDGLVFLLEVRVRPYPEASNAIASGPVLVAAPTKDLVQLRFAAARAGKFNAFVIPSYFNYKVIAADAQFLTLREILSGDGCRVVGQPMGAGATDVNLTNCSLRLEAPDVTIYSAFVYVEDTLGNVGAVSHEVLLNYGAG